MVVQFRNDGYSYVRKRDGAGYLTAIESHTKLQVGGNKVLECYYATRADMTGAVRRIYWLLDATFGPPCDTCAAACTPEARGACGCTCPCGMDPRAKSIVLIHYAGGSAAPFPSGRFEGGELTHEALVADFSSAYYPSRGLTSWAGGTAGPSSNAPREIVKVSSRGRAIRQPHAATNGYNGISSTSSTSRGDAHAHMGTHGYGSIRGEYSSPEKHTTHHTHEEPEWSAPIQQHSDLFLGFHELPLFSSGDEGDLSPFLRPLPTPSPPPSLEHTLLPASQSRVPTTTSGDGGAQISGISIVEVCPTRVRREREEKLMFCCSLPPTMPTTVLHACLSYHCCSSGHSSQLVHIPVQWVSQSTFVCRLNAHTCTREAPPQQHDKIVAPGISIYLADGTGSPVSNLVCVGFEEERPFLPHTRSEYSDHSAGTGKRRRAAAHRGAKTTRTAYESCAHGQQANRMHMDKVGINYDDDDEADDASTSSSECSHYSGQSFDGHSIMSEAKSMANSVVDSYAPQHASDTADLDQLVRQNDSLIVSLAQQLEQLEATGGGDITGGAMETFVALQRLARTPDAYPGSITHQLEKLKALVPYKKNSLAGLADASTHQTLLHLAAGSGSTELSCALILQGAHTTAIDADGRTPLQLAAKSDKLVDAMLNARQLRNALVQGGRGEGRGEGRGGAGIPGGLTYGYPASVSTRVGSRPTSPMLGGYGDDGKPLSGAASVPASPVGLRMTSEDRIVLLSSFGALSLQEKCAVARALQMNAEIGIGSVSRHHSPFMSDEEERGEDPFGLDESPQRDFASQRLSLPDVYASNVAHALQLMSDNERQECEHEANRIQANVRSWLARRNYSHLKNATRVLQRAVRKHFAAKRRVTPGTGIVGNVGNGGVSGNGGSSLPLPLPLPLPSVLSGGVQAHSSLERALLTHDRTAQQAEAFSVIQRSMMRWYRGKDGR
jgi:ankyrin repeat protein